MARLGLHNLQRYVTGFGAATLALYFLVEGESFSILFASAFFFLICLVDTFQAKIPNLCTFSLALVGLGLNFWASGFPGLLAALGGLLLGLGLFFLPFFMGGMGAGDVKALAALGALLGPAAIFQVFLFTAFFGGGMAVLHYLSNRNLLERLATWRSAVFAFAGTRDSGCLQNIASGEMLKFPYAAAIAFGYYAFLRWGAIL